MQVILDLTYESGEKERIEFVEPETFVVGRSKHNTHSQLKGDKYISRHHFILEINPTNCFLKDLGSTNGTKINGVRLTKGETRELFAGDEIYVGRTTINIDIKKGSQENIHLKFPEIRCVECDKIIQIKASRQKSVEAIYTCADCLEKANPLIKVDKSWLNITKRAIKNFPNRIDIEGLEMMVGKKFRREELINNLATLNFTEKQIKILLKYLVDIGEPIVCQGCGKTMTKMADQDGNAREFRSVSLYFCPDCRPPVDPDIKCDQMGNYKLLKLMGIGGMGEVYKAWHTLTGRIVALKKILPHIALDEKGYKLFQREIAVTARLNHPNIVRFYEQGRAGNILYFATEFLNGGDPGDLIRKNMAPVHYKLACDIICQTLEGLEFAHSKNYIHRDIKPENILLNKDKNVLKAKLCDFGLAKNFQDAGCSVLTQEKEFMGTLLFMSPEQLRNYRYVKPPTDLYSMGATFYYLLTGKYIFNYPSPLDIALAERDGKKFNLNQYDDPLLMVLGENPLPIETHGGDIPEKLAKVVNKSVSKKEKERYLSAKEFKEDIMKAIS